MSLFARLFGTRTPQEIEERIIPLLHMMAMDGTIHEHEMLVITTHATELGISRERLAQLIKSAGEAREFKLPSDPEHKLQLLSVAAAIMVSDGDTSVRELAFLHAIANRMSVPPEVLTRIVLHALELGKSLNPGVDVRADFNAALLSLARQVVRG
jgi:uncharacterized tellurite resistance protein B-like protein